MRGDNCKCKCGGEWRVTIHRIGDINDLKVFAKYIAQQPEICMGELKMFTCRKCGMKVVEKNG